MSIVTLRNKLDYKDLIGFDVNQKKVVKSPPPDMEECGDFIRLDDGKIVGFLNASLSNRNLNQFLFFVEEKVFDFKDTTLFSALNYFSDENARFILNKHGEEVINLIYPRKLSADYGGWLVGNWETEKEKDIFHNIHEIIVRLRNQRVHHTKA